MPVTSQTLRVEGLASLQKHFAVIDKELSGDLRDGFRKAAEPVRRDAEVLTQQAIGVGRVRWDQMRVGVTRTSVYVAPKQRGRGTPPNRRRRSYRTTVLPRMIVALRANEGRVRAEAQRVLSTSISKWGRG
jgi:hypothetical protein